jgi:hypothetical protein
MTIDAVYASVADAPIGTANFRINTAVSCNGNPITPEWLPDRCRTNAAARP